MRRANPYGYDNGQGTSNPRPAQHYPSESLAVPPFDGSRQQQRQTGELEPLEVSQLLARFFVKGVVEANNVENILDAMATSKTIQVRPLSSLLDFG